MAYVGVDRKKRCQPVLLEDGSDDVGGVCHEIFHALGREHEHARRDRNNYVLVHWENVQKGGLVKKLCISLYACRQISTHALKLRAC